MALPVIDSRHMLLLTFHCMFYWLCMPFNSYIFLAWQMNHSKLSLAIVTIWNLSLLSRMVPFLYYPPHPVQYLMISFAILFLPISLLPSTLAVILSPFHKQICATLKNVPSVQMSSIAYMCFSLWHMFSNWIVICKVGFWFPLNSHLWFICLTPLASPTGYAEPAQKCPFNRFVLFCLVLEWSCHLSEQLQIYKQWSIYA